MHGNIQFVHVVDLKVRLKARQLFMSGNESRAQQGKPHNHMRLYLMRSRCDHATPDIDHSAEVRCTNRTLSVAVPQRSLVERMPAVKVHHGELQRLPRGGALAVLEHPRLTNGSRGKIHVRVLKMNEEQRGRRTGLYKWVSELIRRFEGVVRIICSKPLSVLWAHLCPMGPPLSGACAPRL